MLPVNPCLGHARVVALAMLPAALFLLEPAPARALCRAESLLVARASLATSYLPRKIAVGDFNGDGILDLATATSPWDPPHANAVAVLLGNGSNGAGDGSFQSPVLYPVGSNPVAVVTADFDGDHILDLAAVNQSAGSVSVLRGQGSGGVGDGTFAPHATLDTGPVPIDIVAGDFKEDGYADLGVLHSLFGIRILAGSAGGSFTIAQNVAVAGTASGNLATGDFGNDGILDLVLARVGGSIAVLLGRGAAGVGNGTFNAPAFYSGAGAFDVADMNGDGRSDLVMGGGGTLSIALGTGAGGFAGPQAISPGYQAGPVRVADVDADGFADIVAGVGSALCVFSSLGAGGAPCTSFDYPALISPGRYTQCLSLGDFDSDGKPDVAAGRIDAAANTASLDVLVARCANGSAPILDVVEDVQNDQGGRVRVSWRRSGQDGLAGTAVTSYAVFQRDPGAESWRTVASVPASRSNVYSRFADTIANATPGSAALTSFYVSALTADPMVSYDSEVLSGASVDNVAPPQAENLTAELLGAGEIRVRWSAVVAPDLARYRVHRVPLVTLPATPPDDGNRIGVPTDAEFLDTEADSPSDVVWYWVGAEDVNGNVGPYASVTRFTTDCERYASLFWNDASDMAPFPPAAAIPPGAPRRPAPAKPRFLDPSVTSYAKALDVPIADAFGSGRLSYELRTGGLHAEARGIGGPKAIEMCANDTYRILGPPSGTPATITLEIALHAVALDCGASPCAGGSATVEVVAGGASTAMTLEVGAGSPSTRDAVLRLSIPATVGADLRTSFDLFATGAAAGGISLDGQIRFTDLPAGAEVTSCGGFSNGVVVAVPPTPVPAAPRLALGALTPVPGSGALTLTFVLESSRPAALRLFDVAGRALLREEVGSLGAGEHRLELAGARGWPSGLYFVSLAQEGRSVSRRVSIVR